MNMGNLIRSAHAFGASFVFTIGATYKVRQAKSDTSATHNNVPWYDWDELGDMVLPKGCQMVGIELTEDAIDLPSFTHPRCAAYMLGPERGSLSADLQNKCDHVIRIPTQFCINVQVAGAIVMYDRIQTLGRFEPRPVMPGGTRGVQLKSQS